MAAKGFSWDEVEGQLLFVRISPKQECLPALCRTCQMGLKVKSGMGGQVKHDIRGSSETGKYVP